MKKEITARRDLIDWRRSKVIELVSKGHNQSEIAKMLVVGIGTVNRDLSYFRSQAQENIRKFIHDKIPEEHEKSRIGVDIVLKEAWALFQNAKDNREKLQALSLAKDCYALREELLSSVAVIDEAFEFVLERNKILPKSKSKSNHGVVLEDEDSSSSSSSSSSYGYDVQISEKESRQKQDSKPKNKTF